MTNHLGRDGRDPVLSDDDKDYLGILLETAYYGEAANGGTCRHLENREYGNGDNELGCVMCLVFDWAERLTGTVPTPDVTDWWTKRRWRGWRKW